MREWFNDTFLNRAFSDDEQRAIIENTIENPDNYNTEAEGGNDTTDIAIVMI